MRNMLQVRQSNDRKSSYRDYKDQWSCKIPKTWEVIKEKREKVVGEGGTGEERAIKKVKIIGPWKVWREQAFIVWFRRT